MPVCIFTDIMNTAAPNLELFSFLAHDTSITINICPRTVSSAQGTLRYSRLPPLNLSVNFYQPKATHITSSPERAGWESVLRSDSGRQFSHYRARQPISSRDGFSAWMKMTSRAVFLHTCTWLTNEFYRNFGILCRRIFSVCCSGARLIPCYDI